MKKYRNLLELKGVLKNKSVALRIDANVPVVNGVIIDDNRLKESLPSIKFILNEGASKLIILSHFGRPKHEHKSEEFSLRQIKPRLEELIGEKIEFTEIENAKTAQGKVILCENLRYNAAEEKGEENFAKQLSEIADFYVNDAFSCSHRAHASISVVANFKPIYAGFLMLKEIESIESIIQKEEGARTISIVGGSKISTKIELLQNLIKKMDYIFIAGGMANTFLYALGYPVGSSLFEKDLKNTALNIMKEAKENKCEIILPIDVIVCKKIETSAPSKMVLIADIKTDDIIVDTGNATLMELTKILENCSTLAWNGPLGIFEVSPFNVSTFTFARTVSVLTRQKKLKSIIGGGDTAAAILASGFKSEMTYISTAGGAFLEWLEGKSLPGVLCLQN